MIARATLALALTASLLAGCNARTAETRDPNVVVCAWISGPDGFLPLVSISSAADMMEELIYARLVDVTTSDRMVPHWATSLAYRVDVSDGGKRYILRLRRGVVWSDGAPLDADDVVFAILLGNNPRVVRSHASDFKLMQSIRALDADTVEIRLSSPSPPFLEDALGETFALPRHVLGRYPPASEREATYVNTNPTFSQRPITSGPWRIVRSVRDSYLIIAPNPHYWGPKPRIANIAFRVYPQQDSLYAAVDAGEVDVTGIPPTLWRVRARLHGAHRFVTWPWNVAFSLVPNYRDPAISWIADPVVKRAMMYALDRRFMTDGILSGQADRLEGPLPSFSPYYEPEITKYPYDPARARRMLDAAGWKLHGDARMKNGRALRITLKTEGATDAIGSDIAELVQANFRAIGIDCTLENEELQTFFSDELASRFQLALRGIILPPYPDDFKYYDSTQIAARGGFNRGFYSNPAIDRVLRDARTAASPALARAALARYQMLAANDLPVLYLYSVRLGAVGPSDLRGFSLSPLSSAALPGGLQYWYRAGPKRAP